MKRVAFLLLVLGSFSWGKGNEAGGLMPYRQWVFHMENGDYETGLKIGSNLLYRVTVVTPDQTYIDEGHQGLLYDLAINLIHLKRWEEARYCLTRFLIETQTEEELKVTFGSDFSRQEWHKKHRLTDQPFFVGHTDFPWPKNKKSGKP